MKSYLTFGNKYSVASSMSPTPNHRPIITVWSKSSIQVGCPDDNVTLLKTGNQAAPCFTSGTLQYLFTWMKEVALYNPHISPNSYTSL